MRRKRCATVHVEQLARGFSPSVPAPGLPVLSETATLEPVTSTRFPPASGSLWSVRPYETELAGDRLDAELHQELQLIARQVLLDAGDHRGMCHRWV